MSRPQTRIRKWTGIETESPLKKSEMQPWEKLDRETSAAYSAFLQYLNLGPGRSVRKAYALSRGFEESDKCKVSATWQNWSHRFQWTRRAEAFDQYEAKKRFERICEVREIARNKVGEHAAKLIEKLLSIAMGTQKVPASVQLRAIQTALEYAGISLPRTTRVEMSGRDGQPVQVESKSEVTLTRERLQSLSQDPEGMRALSLLAMREAAMMVEAENRD